MEKQIDNFLDIYFYVTARVNVYVDKEGNESYYSAQSQCIVIGKKGIEEVATLLGLSLELVEMATLAHEYGHHLDYENNFKTVEEGWAASKKRKEVVAWDYARQLLQGVEIPEVLEAYCLNTYGVDYEHTKKLRQYHFDEDLLTKKEYFKALSW